MYTVLTTSEINVYGSTIIMLFNSGFYVILGIYTTTHLIIRLLTYNNFRFRIRIKFRDENFH